MIQNLTLMVAIRLIFIDSYCMVMLLVLCWILNNNCTILYIVSHSFCRLRVASVNIRVMKDVELPSEHLPHTHCLPSCLSLHLRTICKGRIKKGGSTSSADTYHYRHEIHSFCLII